MLDKLVNKIFEESLAIERKRKGNEDGMMTSIPDFEYVQERLLEEFELIFPIDDLKCTYYLYDFSPQLERYSISIDPLSDFNPHEHTSFWRHAVEKGLV